MTRNKPVMTELERDLKQIEDYKRIKWTGGRNGFYEVKKGHSNSALRIGPYPELSIRNGP